MIELLVLFFSISVYNVQRNVGNVCVSEGRSPSSIIINFCVQCAKGGKKEGRSEGSNEGRAPSSIIINLCVQCAKGGSNEGTQQ